MSKTYVFGMTQNFVVSLCVPTEMKKFENHRACDMRANVISSITKSSTISHKITFYNLIS